MQAPTHTISLERYVETGTVSDGMGGTKTVSEWTDYADGVPARYTPKGEGYVREEQGPVDREAPVVRMHPQHVGEIAEGAYSCDVEDDGTWRVTIDGIGEADDYRLVTDVREIYGFGQIPDTVTLELELQDG